jgi:hypothetical protein
MIVAAAIKKNDCVYTGMRHCNIIHRFPYYFKTYNCIEGFITDKGKFLNRKLAAKHAINCGQVKKKLIMKNTGLDSSDLW